MLLLEEGRMEGILRESKLAKNKEVSVGSVTILMLKSLIRLTVSG